GLVRGADRGDRPQRDRQDALHAAAGGRGGRARGRMEAGGTGRARPVRAAARARRRRRSADRRGASQAGDDDHRVDGGAAPLRDRPGRAEPVRAPVRWPAGPVPAPADGGGLAHDAAARRADRQPRRGLGGRASGRRRPLPGDGRRRHPRPVVHAADGPLPVLRRRRFGAGVARVAVRGRGRGRMRRSLLVLALVIALPACNGDDAERVTPSDPRTNAATTVADPAPTIPEPDAWIPRRAGALAVRLEATWEARREAVRRWVRTGDPDAWPPPDDVELLVLYEQRIYRVLAAHDRLAATVLDRLAGPLAAEDAARLPDPGPRARRPPPAVLRGGRAAVRGGLGAARGRDADRDADGSDRLEQLGRRAGADAVHPVDLGRLRPRRQRARGARRGPRRRELPERLRLAGKRPRGAVPLQPGAGVRHGRHRVRERDVARPGPVLRLLQLAGVRAHNAPGRAAHRSGAVGGRNPGG